MKTHYRFLIFHLSTASFCHVRVHLKSLSSLRVTINFQTTKIFPIYLFIPKSIRVFGPKKEVEFRFNPQESHVNSQIAGSEKLSTQRTTPLTSRKTFFFVSPTRFMRAFAFR